MNKNKILLTLLFLCLPFVAMAQRDTLNVVDWQFSRSTLTPVSATKRRSGSGRVSACPTISSSNSRGWPLPPVRKPTTAMSPPT